MSPVTREALPEPAALWRRLTAEFLGSAFLAAQAAGVVVPHEGADGLEATGAVRSGGDGGRPARAGRD